MTIIIREVTGADESAIAALHTKSWQQTYHGILSEQFMQHELVANRRAVWHQRFHSANPNQQIWVAYEGEDLLGFVCIYLDQHAEYGTLLDNLHVSEDAQGKGIGKALMAQVFDFNYQFRPDEGLYLEVLADNTKAQGFYRALGAVEVNTGFWQSPDGQQVKELIYSWPAEFFEQ